MDNDNNENNDNKALTLNGTKEVNNCIQVNNDSNTDKSRSLEYLSSLMKKKDDSSTFDSEISDPRENNKTIPSPKKSLFQGFEEELAKIRANKSDRKDSIETTSSDSSKTAISPTTPTSLPDLEENIKRNLKNLEDINKIYSEVDTLLKDSIKEKIMEENKHLSQVREKILSDISSECPDYKRINKETSESLENVRKGLSDMTTRINKEREKVHQKNPDVFKSEVKDSD